MIDLLATATYYVDLIMNLLNKENDLSEMINVIQVARLFRLTRHSPGLKVSVLFQYFFLQKLRASKSLKRTTHCLPAIAHKSSYCDLHGESKKGYTILLSISLLNIDRFS